MTRDIRITDSGRAATNAGLQCLWDPEIECVDSIQERRCGWIFSISFCFQAGILLSIGSRRTLAAFAFFVEYSRLRLWPARHLDVFRGVMTNAVVYVLYMN